MTDHTPCLRVCEAKRGTVIVLIHRHIIVCNCAARTGRLRNIIYSTGSQNSEAASTCEVKKSMLQSLVLETPHARLPRATQRLTGICQSLYLPRPPSTLTTTVLTALSEVDSSSATRFEATGDAWAPRATRTRAVAFLTPTPRHGQLCAARHYLALLLLLSSNCRTASATATPCAASLTKQSIADSCACSFGWARSITIRPANGAAT